MAMSSPPTTPMSQASTKLGLDSSLKFGTESYMSEDDAKTLRRRALDRAQQATTSQDILLFLIAFRVLNALSIRTFFQPDEFFQSLEPAWEIAFGANSGAWITWEWRNQLRSAIHPVLFAIVYRIASGLSWLLQLSPIWHADLLIAAPKIFQAVIAALGDYYTWRLGEKVYGAGSNEAWTALVLTVLNPWQWFCSTRTFSNCLETTLTTIALTDWPWQWSVDHGDGEAETRVEVDAEENESCLHVNGRSDQTDELAKLRRCLLLAALACILRPTNILIWICISCFTLFRVVTFGKMVPLPLFGAPVWIHVTSLSLSPATASERKSLIREILYCGGLILGLSTLIDFLYYQRLTFPPLRFIYFNVAQSLAVIYGKNRWDYYFSEGIPLLLTSLLPFGVIGIYQSLGRTSTSTAYTNYSPFTKSVKYQLATIVIIVSIILSLISHKEVRFIYPLLALLHLLAAAPFTSFFLPAISPVIYRATPFTPKRFLLGLLVLVNIGVAILTTTSHQTAPLSVMAYLRKQHSTYYLSQPPRSSLPPAPSTMTIGFLMPCHSTPWRSHLVYPSIKAWALTCEPPINMDVTSRASYVDEADRFYEDPSKFMEENLGRPPMRKSKVRSWFGWLSGRGAKKGFGREDMVEGDAWDGRSGRKTWPEYVVFFEQLAPTMRKVLEGSAYRECWRGWNSWAHDDWRRKGDVLVWCLRRQKPKSKIARGWW